MLLEEPRAGWLSPPRLDGGKYLFQSYLLEPRMCVEEPRKSWLHKRWTLIGLNIQILLDIWMFSASSMIFFVNSFFFETL